MFMRMFQKKSANIAEKKIMDTGKTIIQRMYAKKQQKPELLDTQMKQQQTDFKTLDKKIEKLAPSIEEAQAPKTTRQKANKASRNETPSIFQHNKQEVSSPNQSSSYDPYSIDKEMRPDKYRPDNGYYQYPAYGSSPFDMDVPQIWGTNKGMFKS